MQEWNDYYQHAERHFKDHAATLVQDTDRFTIIDWRNRNGSSNYSITFIVDKKRGSLIVSGDLGDSIAVWYNPVEISDLKKYIGCGAKIDGRVYLWAIAFNMACNQLGI